MIRSLLQKKEWRLHGVYNKLDKLHARMKAVDNFFRTYVVVIVIVQNDKVVAASSSSSSTASLFTGRKNSSSKLDKLCARMKAMVASIQTCVVIVVVNGKSLCRTKYQQQPTRRAFRHDGSYGCFLLHLRLLRRRRQSGRKSGSSNLNELCDRIKAMAVSIQTCVIIVVVNGKSL